MRKLILLLTSVFIAGPAMAQELLADKLKRSGFTCVSRPDGDICTISRVNANGFRYGKPIAILIPTGLTQPDDLLLHIHGHRGVCEPASAGATSMADRFKMLEQMREAGARRSVMIFPVSDGKNTDHDSQLVPQFDKFTSWVEDLVQPKRKAWSVSGHSGAGRVISTALARNPAFTRKTKQIMLLDATYGIPNHIDNWHKIARENPNLRIDSVYIPGTATAPGSQQLKSQIDNVNLKTTRESHCQLAGTEVGRLWRPSAAIATPLPPTRPAGGNR